MPKSLRLAIRDRLEGMFGALFAILYTASSKQSRAIATVNLSTPSAQDQDLIERVTAWLEHLPKPLSLNGPYWPTGDARIQMRQLEGGHWCIDVWSQAQPKDRHVATLSEDELGFYTVQWTNPKLSETQITVQAVLDYMKYKPIHNGIAYDDIFPGATVIASRRGQHDQIVYVHQLTGSGDRLLIATIRLYDHDNYVVQWHVPVAA